MSWAHRRQRAPNCRHLYRRWPAGQRGLRRFIISLHHEIIVWLSSGSMSDRDDGVCRMHGASTMQKASPGLTSGSASRDTPLGKFSAEHVVPMVSVRTMRTQSIERWQDLALAAASVFPCVTRSLFGRLHVGCRTATTTSVERVAFSRDEAKAQRRGVLQGCQDTIPTIADYPFDHISFAHERLLLTPLNMTERDRARPGSVRRVLRIAQVEQGGRYSPERSGKVRWEVSS